MATPRALPITEERLLGKCIPEPMSGCWIWLGARNVHGYGEISVNGVPRGAHRVAYEFWRGPIPKVLHVCHRCDTPPCINPAHLFLGTAKDNHHDMRSKGRFENVRGEGCGRVKVTENQVKEMRLLRRGGWRIVDLRWRYGLSVDQVSSITRGESWSWLPGPRS